MLDKPVSSCSGCPLFEGQFGKRVGFIPSCGDGPILIVGEAGGKDEEVQGVPLVGASGFGLFQQLSRIGIERESFTIHNVLSCTPPNNQLLKMPYEKPAIAKCAPNLDATIEKTKAIARAKGKTFVIVTLGNTAFKRVLELDEKKDKDLLKADFYAYPHWSGKYNAWVLNAPHPAFLLRGNTHLWPVVHFVFQRAIEISDNGLLLEDGNYTLDPTPEGFKIWAEGYEKSLETDPDNPLSYDIETPYKVKVKAEEDLTKDDLDNDHTILRISFSYWMEGKTHTTSVKWSAEYISTIERLFGIARYVLGWNSDKYDYPRVSRHVQIKGIGLDGMVAWHILNTSLPKSLGFVTPYYWQNTSMWKHLSDKQPAFYNAKDADAALRNFRGIKKDLEIAGLWHVYERHWIKLYGALRYMTGKGVLQDATARQEAEDKLTGIITDLEGKMEAAVPREARKFKVLKKAPAREPIDKKFAKGKLSKEQYDKQLKDLEGYEEYELEVTTTKCSACEKIKPARSHFNAKVVRRCAVCGKKWTAKHVGERKGKRDNPCYNAAFIEEQTNPCFGATSNSTLVVSSQWRKPLEFKLSKLGLMNYQAVKKHKPILTRKEKKITFDEDAIVLLSRKYPNDPLYPLITDFRKASKLLTTYVGVKLPNGRLMGGMQIGADGRIHTSFGRNASTLRFTSEDPNLQNLPRPNSKDPTDLANLIRNLIIASPGNILYARDFSGIEAVLVGYFALDPAYIRLAKRDVHTFYTVYAIHELEGNKRISASDLPQLDWPDNKLFPVLEELKNRFKADRNNLYKHLVHAANFMQGAKGAAEKIFSETGVEYPTSTVAKVMDVYYNLFPSIKRWHKNVLEEAEKDGYLRNPFGYVHRFNRVYDYKNEYGTWTKVPGADANKAIAFKAQSTAVGIITEALLRLYYDRFEGAGEYLRLQIHDELFLDVPKDQIAKVDAIVQEEMERPVPELKLPASWGMGDCLNILTEAKAGYQWGTMSEKKLGELLNG